jgi:hypothetical protein
MNLSKLQYLFWWIGAAYMQTVWIFCLSLLWHTFPSNALHSFTPPYTHTHTHTYTQKCRFKIQCHIQFQQWLFIPSDATIKGKLHRHMIRLKHSGHFDALFRASWPDNSFITPTNAHLIHQSIILYCSYMFRCHLPHRQVALHQNIKLNINIKYNRLQSNQCYLTVFVQLMST